MVIHEDLETWTEHDLVDQIKRLLEEGQDVYVEDSGDGWSAKVVEAFEGEETVLWSVKGFTRKGALFEAFHRLWSPPEDQQDGIWALSPDRPSLKAVAQSISDKYSDPPDLDPDEVASVYGEGSDPRRRKD